MTSQVNWIGFLELLFEIGQEFAVIFDAIGVLGFLFYIGGFALLQIGRISGDGLLYPLSNIFGATFVLVSMLAGFNLASFLISVTYILIGAYGICRSLKTQRTFVPKDCPIPPFPESLET